MIRSTYALCLAPLQARQLAPARREQTRVECHDRSAALRVLQDVGVIAGRPAVRSIGLMADRP